MAAYGKTLEGAMNAMAVARLLGGKVQGDSEMPVTGVSDIAHAKEGDVTFVQTPALAVAASKSAASVVLVAPGLEVPGKTVVEVKNPKYAFVRLLAALGPREETPAGVDERAFVDPSAELAEGVWVGGGP
jgi:UDP-3-O-[3-hydroxymyristoyl] glucosamine N-acyltransferase